MKCEINWSIFWEAASAIATFSAVVVALWQTKYANRKKAKVAFNYIKIVPSISVVDTPDYKYVGVRVSNVGNRKIIIKNMLLELPNKNCAIIQLDATPLETISFPIELDIEETVFLPWKEEKFLRLLESEESLRRNQKLTFNIIDSVGSIYKCKTPKTVQQYLDAYKEKSENE